VTWVFVVVAIVAGGAALAIGLPAWRAYRSREALDRNAERYLTWRGRADPPGASMREGMTTDERRRIWAGAALGAVAIVCLVIGLVTG
jgi:hypothetical protein